MSNLAMDAKNRVAIAAKQGIEAVVRAMGAHESSTGVQERGCSALVNLAAKNLENKVAIVETGGIEAVVRAMAAHQWCAVEVQEVGCRALHNIVLWGSGLGSHVREADAVTFVKKALPAFPYDWVLQTRGRVFLMKLGARPRPRCFF